MDNQIQRHVRLDSCAGAVVPAENDFAGIAGELVTAARWQGIGLTGPDGLLTGLTRQVLQTALEVEMSEHLGYDKHDPVGRNGLKRIGGEWLDKAIQDAIESGNTMVRKVLLDGRWLK